MKKRLNVFLLLILLVCLLTGEDLQIGNGIMTTNHTPINFNYKNSLSETMYYAEEFCSAGINGGNITGITYYYSFNEGLTSEPVNLWIGETEVNALPTSWIAAGDLTQVFSGNLDLPFDQDEIYIEFDEPYTYNGDNLVLLVERVMDTEYYSSHNVFYYEETPEYPSRMLYLFSDIVDYDPYSPQECIFFNAWVPNTKFEMDFTGFSSLSGYINDSVTGEGLEGVTVELTMQETVITTSIADGYYDFPGLRAGNYEIHFSKFGYSEITFYVNIPEGEPIEQNIELNPWQSVSVTGRVVGNDDPSLGISGAILSLEGMEDYVTTSNDEGIFNFVNVYVNMTYLLTVYTDFYANYSDELIIEEENLDLGDLILTEMNYPVGNITAEINDDDSEALIFWEIPGSPVDYYFNFEFDDGDFESNDAIGWNWGDDEFLGANSGDNAWVTALNNNYVNWANWFLTSPEVNIPTAQTQLTFFHNMECENNFDGGNVKISTDDGSTWQILTPVGGYPDDEVQAMNEPGYTYGFTGWSQAIFSLAEYEGEDVRFRWHFGSDTMNHDYLGWAIDDVRIGEPQLRTLESYSIYRGLLGDESNVSNWEQVAENVTDTCFVDESWGDLISSEVYRYAVKAEYTSGACSEARFSNWVAANMSVAVTVNITTDCGDIPQGAIVQLSSTEEGPDGEYLEYQAEADEEGVCVFNRIWMGNYDLDVEFYGFGDFESNIDIYDDVFYAIELIEQAWAPQEVSVAETHSGSAYLLWHSPQKPQESIWDFEDDNGGYSGENGWAWADGSNSGTTHSGENCWSIWPGGNYPNSANTSLYSPLLQISDEETQLQFYHWYNMETDWDGGNLKISTDYGESWSLITPAGGYPETSVSTSNAGIPGEPCWNGITEDWISATFELGEYVDEDVMFRFHFGSDTAMRYPGWDIDDVEIITPQYCEDVELFNDKRSALYEVLKDFGARDERMLSGYNIYRGLEEDMSNYENWILIAEAHIDTVYDDTTWPQITLEGDYVYCVRALYSGEMESDPAFSNPMEFDLEVPVSIIIGSNSGDPTDGAFVELVNQNGNPQNVYAAIAENGAVNWNNILRGYYNLTIELSNFAFYEQYDININCSTSLNIELEELITPPANPAVDETNGIFTWSMPENDDTIARKDRTENQLSPYSQKSIELLSRNVEYFKIYLDGENIGQTMLLSSDLSNLAEMIYGESYTAGVTAQYSSGSESEAAEVEFTCYFSSPSNGNEIPQVTQLTGNHPNPFNPETEISYQIAGITDVTIDIYNIRGQLVRQLIDARKEPGYYKIIWNGRNDADEKVSSGLYFCVFRAGGSHKVSKMMLLK